MRTGHWQGGIRFEEIVTHWDANRAMQWRFAFPDPSISLKTDPHIDPHGRQLWIDKGGYRLTPMPGGKTKVELWTQYDLITWLNGYAALWGDVMLGDIQDNVLAIIKQRSEATSRSAP